MAEQRWMRSPWLRIALGLVGVVVLYDGISDIRGGARAMQSNDPTAAQEAAVPGYGPPNANASQTYAPANANLAYAPPIQTQMNERPRPEVFPENEQQSSQYPADRSPAYDANARGGARVYRDAQGRYEIAIPAGWQAIPQQGNLEVRNGNAYALLAPFNAQMSGEQIVSAMTRQYNTQWQRLQMVTQGQVMLSGAPGAYVMLRGQNPRGVESLLRIAAASSGGQAWMFVISAPLQEFNQVASELQQIETSFAVGRQ